MTEEIWLKTPPHPGWWIASWKRETDYARYWDGVYWSLHVSKNMDAELAADRMVRTTIYQEEIEYCRPATAEEGWGFLP